MIETIALTADGEVRYLDQTRLPAAEVQVTTADWRQVAAAIRALAIRGAPAIGVAAAMGVAVAARAARPLAAAPATAAITAAIDGLRATRPTAVNLFWALDRMRDALARARAAGLGGDEIARVLAAEARAIHAEDLAQSRAIGEHGAALVPARAQILTHCNAGGLATGGLGTALAVIYAAQAQGKEMSVLVDETRPLLQGARLTAWELMRAGIPVTLITDSMAGSAMARLGVDLVVVGADRIGQNGDVANKIGTYPLAVLASRHRVPFYVAAPSTTIDPDLRHGADIPIEERAAAEITTILGTAIAPQGIRVWNPAFDVTPGELVTGIMTERGVIRPPYAGKLEGASRQPVTGRDPVPGAAPPGAAA
jgi:methylthioribose-1-phosphate isomerase